MYSEVLRTLLKQFSLFRKPAWENGLRNDEYLLLVKDHNTDIYWKQILLFRHANIDSVLLTEFKNEGSTYIRRKIIKKNVHLFLCNSVIDLDGLFKPYSIEIDLKVVSYIFQLN